jgi:ATP-dependent exoDNAse (exonuclease V) alpha subunit
MDRVMFLQNERGLGVKNGTLGIVEHVSSQSMTVRTDDGRSVSFDLRITTGSAMAMRRRSTRRRA